MKEGGRDGRTRELSEAVALARAHGLTSAEDDVRSAPSCAGADFFLVF